MTVFRTIYPYHYSVKATNLLDFLSPCRTRMNTGLELMGGSGLPRSRQCCKSTSFIAMNLFAGMKVAFALNPIFFTKHLFVKCCFFLLFITVISLAPSNITHYTVTIL